MTLLCLALTVAAAVRAPRWTGAALGLLVSKQYALLFLPFVALLIPVTMTRRQVGRRALAALVTAALTATAVVLWDPAAAWRRSWSGSWRCRAASVRVVEPVRGEVRPRRGVDPPLAAGVAWAWASCADTVGLRDGRRDVIGAFFTGSKQAFPNYHLLVIGGVCLAVAVAALRDGAAGPQDGTSGPVSSAPPVR
ncbi:MAG: hypothetical protein U0869_20730 [Chloroflexota bacterium]